MTKSPGHQQMPGHQVREEVLRKNIKVSVYGEVIADSDAVIKVSEDGCPPRYYFRRDDVRLDKLEAGSTTSECPFKGIASYFNLKAGGTTQTEVVWSYEQPYDEHADLQGRLAFYEEKLQGIQITPKE